MARGEPVDRIDDEEATQDAISSLVRLLLRHRGPQKQELADALAMTPSSLSQRLRQSGEHRPWRVHEVRSLARYYEISTDALLGDESAREEVLEELKEIARQAIEEGA